VDWYDNKAVMASFRDQFTPYEGYGGLDWSKPFSGTLFRLPLRTAQQAESSLLSRRVLSVDEASDLLDALIQEASAMLLFLKNVECIEIRRWDIGESHSKLIFSSNIKNISPELRSKRAFVGTNMNMTPNQGIVKNGTISAADYSLLVSCKKGVRAGVNADDSEYEERWEVCNQLGGQSTNLIAFNPSNVLLRLVPWGGLAACISSTYKEKNTTGGNEVLDLASFGVKSGLAYCFLPLPVLTGLPVMVNGFFELSSNRRDVWQSGLGGAEMTGDGRTRAEWNLSLMKDVIAPSYVRLLLRARDILGFSDSYQNLWPPAPSFVSFPWSLIVESTLFRCRPEKLLYVGSLSTTPLSNKTVTAVAKEVGGVSFLNTALTALHIGSSAVVVSGKVVNKDFSNCWVVCSEAVLLPNPWSSSQGSNLLLQALTVEQEDLLERFFLEAHRPFVRCTTALRGALSASKTCVLLAIPALVRIVLRNEERNHLRAENKGGHYTPSAALCTSFLLQYCLSDLNPNLVADCEQLDSLSLLPLKDGTVGTIRVFSEIHANAVSEVCGMGFSVSQSIWALSQSSFDVLSACQLLTSVESLSSGIGAYQGVFVLAKEEVTVVFSAAGQVLIDSPTLTTAFFTGVNMQKLSNIRIFQASLVPDLLRHILPPSCFTGESVILKGKGSMSPTSSSDPVIDLEALLAFVPAFWIFASNQADVITAISDGAAIVPSLPLPILQASFSSSSTGSASIIACEEKELTLTLSPLSRMSALFAARRGDVSIPEGVRDLLQSIGVRVVDPVLLSNSESGSIVQTFWEYVYSPSRTGLLAVIDSVMRTNSINKSSKSGSVAGIDSALSIDLLDAAQREDLRLYLTSCEPISNMIGGVTEKVDCFFC
jgi:hypothetical protein